MVATDRPNAILFDTTKNELFKLNDNYKNLQRKLKGQWKIASNREDSAINLESLSQVKLTKFLSRQIKIFTIFLNNCPGSSKVWLH